MSQLMSKDVLYEPLKELHTKFPAYLKDNAATMKAEDKQRFESQQKIVTQIVEIFEDPSYSPENADQGIKIVNLMNTVRLRDFSRAGTLIYVIADAKLWFTAARNHGPSSSRSRLGT